jgi:glycosyltransferase involved in cell wall biosynthesis
VNYLQILPSANLGGVGLVALHIADYLRRRSRAAHIWIPGDGPAFREADRLGLGPRTYDSSPILSPRRMKAAIGNLTFYKIFRQNAPGIAHVHSPFVYRAIWPALRLSRLRRVVHVHLEEGQIGLRWALSRPPDLIITCSRSLIEYVRRTLPDHLQERQWIEAVPNSVDTVRFRPAEKRAAKERVGAPADTPLVLMLANLAPHKGQETTIRAVAALKQRGVDVACWLAGAERQRHGYMERLQALVAELGVQDRVRLLGQRSDVPELLQAADLFLLPSTSEGLPLSILEAQATKVPVLAAPTAGIPEVVVEGETGFLIPADDANGYANRIVELLENPGLSRRIVENAFKLVCENYNWESYCKRIECLYDAIADGRIRKQAARVEGPQTVAPLVGTGGGIDG